MRLFVFVAAPFLVLAQDAQNSTNSNVTAESKAVITGTKTDSSPAVKNAEDSPMSVSSSDKSMSVIGASGDTIIVFVPTTASMTITEKTIEQQVTTFTKVAETTFVSVSIRVHATTILPTIRRPILQGAESSNSASMNINLQSALSLLFALFPAAILLLIF